jgi:hypothetical protein
MQKVEAGIFMPARMRLSSISSEFDAGPMVATVGSRIPRESFLIAGLQMLSSRISAILTKREG